MTAFQQVQRQFTSHVRNPANGNAPEGIEPRRLKIYQELVYNNIEGFVSNNFPVLRSLYTDERWHAMVRAFVMQHPCHSPSFLEISQEFLLYLQQTRIPADDDPPFLFELAHYEWVELALDVAEQDIKQIAADPNGDLLKGIPVVSPLAWSLAYHYPVHQIGKDFQPDAPAEQPTYLVVYRDRTDQVQFMEANWVTARLLELLSADQPVSGRHALEHIARELQHSDSGQIVDSGEQLLQQLLAMNIILGTAPVTE